ncbi:MAG: class I SAM-dependent methyltransferase [Litorilinea sp.]
MLSFRDFVRLGADQQYAQSNPLAAAFFRLVGPLGTHARIRNARVINTLWGMDLNGKRVLDVGCGHGYTLFWLARRFPGATLLGMDIDAAQIAGCRRATEATGVENLHFRPGVYTDLPDDAAYDLVIAIDVLEHLHEDEAMLAKIATVLRPGGTVVIHVPLRHQVQRRILPAFRAHTVHDHVRDEYLPHEIVEKVTRAGLQVDRLAYGFGWWGELGFELNNLFWQSRLLRNLTALATLPIALWAGYRDACSRLPFGNSMVLLASRPHTSGRVILSQSEIG